MRNHILVIGKGALFTSKGMERVPDKLRIFKSKFERDLGDVMKLENETWNVISTEFTSLEEARDYMQELVKIYKEKGLWEGYRKVKSRF